MKIHLVLIFLFIFSSGTAQDNNYTIEDLSINSFIDGTLLTPITNEKPVLAIVIADSGPTDRNGNQNFLKSNNIKKLAEYLSSHDIATFRYDKRIVKQIKRGNVDKNIRFDDFVKDAVSVIDYFKKTNLYSKIYIIGHSQGSLVGMLAAKDKVDGFISLAGSGNSIDKVIIDQIEKTAAMYTEDTKRVFNSMRNGKTTRDFPEALSSIFNFDIQPFMMSWMQYNPQDIIKSLDMPVLIINGTKDLQVTVEEANLLKEASKNAELTIIDKMNHVLFIIEGDDLENSKSYNESSRKISQELLDSIIIFINQNKK
jgi:hypothetical protein